MPGLSPELQRALDNSALPPATDITTRAAANARLALVTERIKLINRALNEWRGFARTDDEKERVDSLTTERGALIEYRAGLLDMSIRFDAAEQTSFHRAFMRAVKEAVPDAQYRKWIERANEIEANAKARAAAQTVGAAIEPIGNAGPMRRRA